MITPRDRLVWFCRPGFEDELGAEVVQWAGASVRLHASGGAGWVLLDVPAPEVARELAASIRPFTFVFARQWFRVLGEGTGSAEPGDVIAVLEETARRVGGAPRARDLVVEAPDSGAGRRLWPRCEALSRHLRPELEARGWLSARHRQAPRLHVALVPEGRFWVGVSDPRNSSPWPGGIARLMVPAGAPSRSARKVEEALHVLLTEHERQKALKPGRRVVDLGAAPGGWSWQFARRGLLVTAVDNARLASEVLETGLVDHVRADGFRFRPDRPVDWMVCDMVKPAERVARLVGLWAAQGRARWLLFNWKLPGGRRFEAVQRCRAIVDREMGRAGKGYTLRLRHLYHDRDEVTGYLAVGERKSTPARRSRRPGRRR
ncbi:MAG: 23S rRNA (cytidine(2498)-2'-O)-methyltransferase RlmM [Deltaproteobacteria bacterium]|nr:23S rRNA (cytidine(2498)-2'-O)-methyltransferase RlmM [Deltaproteobacteria bacterium]